MDFIDQLKQFCLLQVKGERTMQRSLLPCLSMVLILSLAACGSSSDSQSWSVAYDVVGTERAQLWDVKADDLLTALNEAVPENMQLRYLNEYDPSSMSCPLTTDGETWKILLDVFAADQVDSFPYKNEEDASEWINNVGNIELDLYSTSDEDAEENGIYVREIISILTPGAEQLVEDALGLYGEPEKSAVISDGVRRVSADSVTYTYFVNQKRFIAEPHVAPWPVEEEEIPTVIRPE